MRLLDSVFILLYKSHLDTWPKAQDPHDHAASNSKSAFTVMFFLLLLIPVFKCCFFLMNRLELQLPRTFVVFSPMILAYLTGWKLSRWYYEKRGRKATLSLSAKKLAIGDKVQVIIYMLIFILFVSVWSMGIAYFFPL